MQVQIIIRGSAETRAKLKRLGNSLTNFKSAFDDIGTETSKYYQDVAFGSQGGVYGKAWPKLSPATVAIKSKKYPQYVNVPLVASGTMRDSFSFMATRNGVVITNDMPYYKYHQSTLPRTHLPRRQMAGINDFVKNKIVKRILEDDIAKKIRNA